MNIQWGYFKMFNPELSCEFKLRMGTTIYIIDNKGWLIIPVMVD